MKQRLALIAGTTVVVVGAAYWFLPSTSGSQPAQARRSAKVDVRSVEPAASEPAPVQKPRMVMTESGPRPQTSRKTPRTWVDPVSGAVHREILDAVPDPAAAAAEELRYRKRRLPFKLSDAAAQCWSGPDSKEELELEYTLIVEGEVMRLDNVRVQRSNITDPTVERCIVDSVRQLRSVADKIPDMREDGGMIMSLHDLHDRNDRAARAAKPDDKP